jgi:hypothetical protein
MVFFIPVYVLITKPVCIFNPLAVGFAKPITSIMAGIIGKAKIQAVVPAGFFHIHQRFTVLIAFGRRLSLHVCTSVP